VSQSGSFCTLPWLHRFTNEEGYHKLCCVSGGPSSHLHDAAGKPLHISQGLTDAALLNSPDLKQIRLAMLRGEWPEACERCQRDEAASAASMRNHMNDRFGVWTGDLLSMTRSDGTLERPAVRYADIRLGNVCNLTCRMCGPQSSRLWADHYNAVQPRQYRLKSSALKTFRDENWVKRQPVQWLIEQCLPTVESLHFAGGEPLIIPEMVELLEACIQSSRAGQIALSYNTNLTVLPKKVTDLWPHFRSVSLVCSIDGFGRLNDYIRRPSNWSDIERNLESVDRNFKTWNMGYVICSATVQIYNILQLGELFDYVATRFRHITPVPALTALYSPEYLSIQILPSRLKDIARTKLLALRAEMVERLPLEVHHRLNSIDAMVAFMDEANPSGQLEDFLYFCEKSDRKFGDSWRQSCPDLAAGLTPPSFYS
jgi:hypothetical protein